MALLGSGRRRRIAWIGNPSKTRFATKSEQTSVLTASGARITQKDAESMRRLVAAWQARAFTYYDQVGEIKYAAQFYARMLSPLRLYVAKKDENGDLVEVDPAKDPDVVALLDRVQDPGGGRAGLLGSYGRLMFLAGECYLYVTKNPDTGMEQWEMLSTDEVRPTGNTYTRYRAPSLEAEQKKLAPDDELELGDDTAIAYRIWRRHPRFSWLADATMMGVLDIAEELLLLTRAVRSRAKSRLAGNGLLLIPEGVGPAPVESRVGDEDLLDDPFFREFVEHIIAPLTDEGSASASAPLIVRAHKDLLDAIRHLPINDPTQLYPETGLRRECVDRLAIGLDMPPEILTGTGDANHWSGWQIDEQAWKAHGMPVAQQFCDDLTGAYFRPALIANQVKDWLHYQIAYDPTAVINHPDRAKDAKDVHDRGSLSDEALRNATGFTEDDAPSEEEKNVWIGVRVRDSGLAKTGIPTLTRGAELEPSPGEILSPAPGGGTITPGESSSEVAKGPPAAGAPTEQTPAPVTSSGNGYESSRLLGACDLALYRARELAGNRIRSHANRVPEARKIVEAVRPHLAAHALGPEGVRALGLNETQLVAGAGDLIADALHVFGIRDGQVADRIADQVERHAARTLYEVRPTALPPSLQNYVLGLVPVPA